jgi:hypothetical protein
MRHADLQTTNDEIQARRVALEDGVRRSWLLSGHYKATALVLPTGELHMQLPMSWSHGEYGHMLELFKNAQDAIETWQAWRSGEIDELPRSLRARADPPGGGV